MDGDLHLVHIAEGVEGLGFRFPRLLPLRWRQGWLRSSTATTATWWGGVWSYESSWLRVLSNENHTHNIYGINPEAYQSSCSPCWSQSHELLGCQTQVQLHPQHARSSHQTALEPLHRPPQPPAGRNVCLIRMLIYNEISHPHCNMHVLIQMNVTCEYVGYMATLPKSSQLKPGASWDTRGWAWAWMNNSEVNLLFSLMLSCSSPSSTISSDCQ